MNIFPIANPSAQQPLRNWTWSVKQTPHWNTLVHETPNGARFTVPLFPNNPLWEWEWTYEYLKDDPNDLNLLYPVSPAPPTDIQILKAFYMSVKGAGFEFLYQPWDSVVVGQPLAAVDANNNTELVHTVGGVPSFPFGGGSTFTTIVESVQELNGVNPVIKVAGTPTSFGLLGPNSTPPYEGYAIHFSSPPAGAITADYTYFYRVAFTDDSLDFEYFMFNLVKLASLKFKQVRVVN